MYLCVCGGGEACASIQSFYVFMTAMTQHMQKTALLAICPPLWHSLQLAGDDKDVLQRVRTPQLHITTP